MDSVLGETVASVPSVVHNAAVARVLEADADMAMQGLVLVDLQNAYKSTH